MPNDNEEGRVSLSPFVKDSDLLLVAAVSGAALLVLVLFGLSLFGSGLLDFQSKPEHGAEAYFSEALYYRERRVSLALTLRSFLTGFSFVVGLALSTIGGVFILRQVTSLTRFSVNAPETKNNKEEVDGDAGLEWKKKFNDSLANAAFKLEAYSPGIIFLLGGLIIIVTTQYFSIPIATMDVYPSQAIAYCVDAESSEFVNCASLNREAVQGGGSAVGTDPGDYFGNARLLPADGGNDANGK
ncbi:MAG: hypothetical protein H6896_00440 [Rhodovulum sp.]|nr:hypothetical protein [Rhodovulum sp.]